MCYGPECVAQAVQDWIKAVDARTATIAPGSPWENGTVASFNARLRDERLDGEISYALREAQIVIESWRRHDNTVRPHGSIGYKPPAPEVFVPACAAWPATQPRPAPPAMLTLAPTPTLNQHHASTTRWGRSSIAGYDDVRLKALLAENLTLSDFIKTPDRLFGRDKALTAIDRALSSPGRQVFVYGDRGVGKTSLALTAAFIGTHGSSIPIHVNCGSTNRWGDWGHAVGPLKAAAPIEM